MALVANDPKAAKRLGISQSVGRDFMKADKGRKFGSGGSMKESKAMMRKEVAFMKKKGAPKSMIRHEEEEMRGGGKGKVKKFSGIGEAEVWLESFSTLEKSRFIDREDFKVVRGTAQMGSFSLENLLSD